MPRPLRPLRRLRPLRTLRAFAPGNAMVRLNDKPLTNDQGNQGTWSFHPAAQRPSASATNSSSLGRQMQRDRTASSVSPFRPTCNHRTTPAPPYFASPSPSPSPSPSGVPLGCCPPKPLPPGPSVATMEGRNPKKEEGVHMCRDDSPKGPVCLVNRVPRLPNQITYLPMYTTLLWYASCIPVSHSIPPSKLPSTYRQGIGDLWAQFPTHRRYHRDPRPTGS
ncbi:hypothetical protein F5883DRAFT_527638 [Diaporthe sp. PMI_573]|nr:hypothetical protein F5883DRAFT_527638 [Diaporthaceae sp. PMI_573]